jgi:hypothetical protein
MASVIFTIHTGATQAWGGEVMNKLFGDYHFNKNRWRKIVAQDQQHNPRPPCTWGGDIELAVVAWLLQVNLHVLTRPDESALDKRSVRSFYCDNSARSSRPAILRRLASCSVTASRCKPLATDLFAVIFAAVTGIVGLVGESTFPR